MADFEVTGTVTLDAGDMLESVDEILDKLDEFSAKIDEIDEKLAELEDHEIRLSIVIDNEEKLDELKVFLAELDDRIYDVKLRINIDGEEKLEALQLQLDKIDEEPHDVKINVNDAELADAEAKIEALNLQLDELKNKEKAATDSSDGFEFSMMMLAPALIPVSAGILSLIGGIGGLASSFVTMAPPVALAAYGVDQLEKSVTTLYSGLSATVQASLMNATSMSQMYNILEKNSAAFRSLDSGVKQVVIGYVTFKQLLDQFQSDIKPEAVQVLANVFQLLDKSISLLIDPAIQAAGAIAKLIALFSARLDDSTFQKFFDDMDKNIGTLVTNWGTGVINIIEGITAILDAFMPLGVTMSKGFDNATKSFDTWAQHLSQSKGFQNFVKTVETDGPKILNILGQVVKFIANLVTQMGESKINTKIFDGLDTFLKNLNSISSSHPGLTQLAGDLTAVGLGAIKLGPALGPLMEFLTTPVGAVVGAIVALGIAFIAAYKSSSQFGNWVRSNIVPLLKDLGSDVTQMKNFFVSIWPEIQEIWKKYGSNIMSIIMVDLRAVVSIVGDAMKLIEGIINIVLGLLTGNWKQVWTGIKDVFDAIWSAIKTILNAAVNEIENVLKMAWKIVSTDVSSAWDGIVHNFETNVGKIEGWVKGGWDTVTRDTVQWGKDVGNAVVTAWNAVINFFKGVPGDITKALGDLGSLLVNAGEDVIKGFLNGLKNAAGSVESWLSSFTSDLTSWKGPPERDRTLLNDAGSSIIQSLIDGMESKYGAVKASLQGLTNSMGSSMSKQLTTSVQAKIQAGLQSSQSGAVGAALGGTGAAGGGSGQTQVVFAAGSIQINNPSAEQPGTSLTRTMQAISKFGTIQTPMGMSTNPS